MAKGLCLLCFHTHCNEICINFNSGNAYHLPPLHIAHNNSTSLAHVTFLTTLPIPHEPNSYQEAILDPTWIEPMNAELDASEKNHTCEIVELPPSKSTVGCAWKLKLKYNVDGTLNKPKSRLVAQGFIQIEGLDYHDSFSPVAN